MSRSPTIDRVSDPEITIHRGGRTIGMRFSIGTPLRNVSAQLKAQMKIADGEQVLVNGRASSPDTVIDDTTRTVEFRQKNTPEYG